MGDPRHSKKSYQKPTHPWQKERIVSEQGLSREYGVKNKRELWKMQGFLRNFGDQAKKLIAATGDQAEKERKQLMARLLKYGLVDASATLDTVLSLTTRDIMERRLQTQVYKKGLARTPRQARQFITHCHVMVAGTMVTSPSYLVLVSEETQIEIVPQSALADPEHPERKIVSESQVKKEAEADAAEEKKDAPAGEKKEDVKKETKEVKKEEKVVKKEEREAKKEAEATKKEKTAEPAKEKSAPKEQEAPAEA